jgi:microcystin-dependent protein
VKKQLALLALASSLIAVGSASAQTPYLGEVRLVGFNFCPTGWTPAQGQLLAIQSNTALFALYGTTYGGDGVRTFGLPDLRGRAPYGTNTNTVIGEQYGASTVTLLQANLPFTQPQLRASTAGPTTNNPGGALIATFPAAEKPFAAGNTTTVNMAPSAIAPFGGSQPFSIQSPALAMTWCVALQGVFPSRP